jgi:hypothetical protein
MFRVQLFSSHLKFCLSNIQVQPGKVIGKPGMKRGGTIKKFQILFYLINWLAVFFVVVTFSYSNALQVVTITLTDVNQHFLVTLSNFFSTLLMHFFLNLDSYFPKIEFYIVSLVQLCHGNF